MLAVSLASLLAFCASSAVLRRKPINVFLSHAKGSGGAVARLFKIMLLQRFPRITAFIDSDNLVSLHQLIGHVQATKNLVLILTLGVFTREWVAVEIVTCHIHRIHVLMAKVDGSPPPDLPFLERIPEMFGKDTVSTGFRALGMKEDLILDAYVWLRTEHAVDFNVCARFGDAADDMTAGSICWSHLRDAPLEAVRRIHTVLSAHLPRRLTRIVRSQRQQSERPRQWHHDLHNVHLHASRLPGGPGYDSARGPPQKKKTYHAPQLVPLYLLGNGKPLKQ